LSTLRVGRRRSAILPTLVVVAVLVVLFAVFTSVWTDRLWYRSFDYGSVFTKMLTTRIGLFAGFGLIMAAAVAGNAALAYRLRPRLGAATPSSALLDRYRELLESRFTWVTLGVAALIGLFAGGTASGQVFDYLAWRNATPFNVKDPQFGLDISFFVFGYPWWRFVLSFAFATLVVSVIATAIVHYTMGGLRLSGVRRGTSRAAAAHLSVLIGLAVLVRGIGYWFDQYGLEISRTNRLFTGISYTADHATVTAKLILAIIAGICGLLFFANAVLHRWAVPVIGVVLLLLSAIVLGLVYPGAVQYFTVRPNEPDRERDYIVRNINATRAAYGVEDVEINNYSAETTASAGQLSEDAEALPGIRLIDPNVVGPAFEQLQQVRGFYSFPRTLDVDRYTIEGQETDAVVAVREMDLHGLESANWNNLKTVYTHGYGLVAAYGNRRQPSGEPEWIVRDIPPVGPLAEYEPRIYFGELQGQRSDEFSIVGARAGAAPIELDTPGGGEGGNPKTTTYTGKGGVPIGNLWNRVLYAAKFADVNILLSDRVNEESKIIYDRTPRERVQAAAPWLKVDGDAYPAVVEGRIVWIVDGYTTSNSYPNSERVNLGLVTADAQTSVGGTVVAQPQDDINYVRNSVKAVVDAYDGSVRLFAWDDADPVLQTWRKTFPGVVEDKNAIPADLLEHLRYPQDLFKVQRQILTNYHVTDAGTWYSNSNLWEVPNDPVQASSQVKEQPFYLSVKWPGDTGPIFSLTTSYVPRGRQNLAAYMAVNADASSPEYGRMRILSMSDTSQIDGPGQSFNAMTTNETVAERLRPFLNQGAATATFGNLLTLPLGDGLLYVTPVYTQRQGSTGSYPALRFVIVRFGQSVGIGDTLKQALDQVFQGSSGAPPEGEPTTEEPPATGEPDNPAATRALKEAEAAFNAAEKALTEGNLTTYQSEIKKARAAVESALNALGQ
jgi:uncharacterized protein